MCCLNGILDVRSSFSIEIIWLDGDFHLIYAISSVANNINGLIQVDPWRTHPSWLASNEFGHSRNPSLIYLMRRFWFEYCLVSFVIRIIGIFIWFIHLFAIKCYSQVLGMNVFHFRANSNVILRLSYFEELIFLAVCEHFGRKKKKKREREKNTKGMSTETNFNRNRFAA